MKYCYGHKTIPATHQLRPLTAAAREAEKRYRNAEEEDILYRCAKCAEELRHMGEAPGSNWSTQPLVGVYENISKMIWGEE